MRTSVGHADDDVGRDTAAFWAEILRLDFAVPRTEEDVNRLRSKYAALVDTLGELCVSVSVSL